MTPKQTKKYWREWGAVSRACKAGGRAVPDRHALHRQALGRDRSSKVFSNAEFDKVLGVFRSLSAPGDMNGQLRQMDQPVTRGLFALREVMKCLALYVTDADAYAASVALDQFGTADVESLNPKQLKDMKFTLNSRINKKGTGFRNKAGDSLHDMRLKAGLQCHCKGCAEDRGSRVADGGDLPAEHADHAETAADVEAAWNPEGVN